MNKKFKWLVIACFILLLSCTDSLFEELSINDKIPFIIKPEVNSFEIENSIVIEWEKDTGADEFILYRDTSPTGNFSEIVYRGKSLSYADYDISFEHLYYYKLAKRREKKIFNKSEPEMGIASDTIKDNYENNDTKETSALFPDFITANIYYYENLYGNTMEDKDWYRVMIPPRKFMVINILNEYNLNSQTDSSGTISDLSLIVVDGIKDDNVEFNAEYNLVNDQNESKIKYFCIYPNREKFISSSPSPGVRGKLGIYRIDFEGLKNIQD